jgi:hypothetical protein
MMMGVPESLFQGIPRFPFAAFIGKRGTDFLELDPGDLGFFHAVGKSPEIGFACI